MAKYYITNGCKFIGENSERVNSINDAVRFDYSDGQSYVNKYMKRAKSWRLQSIFPHNKRYVLTTATCFVGKNAPITNDYTLAMSFGSVADATNYIKKHPAMMKSIPHPLIVAENFETVEKPQIKTFINEQPKTINVKKNVATPRVKISPDRKAVIAQTSGEICAICGLPMNDWEKTLDHITPLSRGGSNDNSNLRYVHGNCNKLKSDMLDKELFQIMANIGAKRIYENPQSEDVHILVRAMARGILASYSKRGLLPNFEQLGGENIWENMV